MTPDVTDAVALKNFELLVTFQEFPDTFPGFRVPLRGPGKTG